MSKRAHILTLLLFTLLSETMLACDQAKNTPKEGKLNQAIITGGACVDQKKSVPEGSRGIIRVDVIKNFRSGTSEVVGQGFVSKKPMAKGNLYDFLGLDPRSKMAQRSLDLINLGLTLDLYFEDRPSSEEPGLPSVVSRERIQQAVNAADPAEVEKFRQRLVTMKGRREDMPGFFRAQSQKLAVMNPRSKSETIDGLRGMGPFVSFVLMTKVDALAGVELLIPSDPQPDDVDFEDPTKMPMGKSGGSLMIPVEADPNRPEEYYGARFKDRSLVVEFQGKDRGGDWVRRCVAPDTGEATTLEVPLNGAALAGKVGPISVVLARKYRTVAPVAAEGGGDIYFEVNSVVVTGGGIAPADAPAK